MSVTNLETIPEEVVTTVIDSFHHMAYVSGVWERTFWRGQQVAKCPTDLFIYQEIIHAVKPDYIVETGTLNGGSALFFADIMELEGRGEVITIDNTFVPDRPAHPRITYINDESVHAAEGVGKIVEGKKVVVSLDSSHRKEHVLQEMEAYGPIANEYMVVEDTNIGHPIPVAGIDEGPWEAVEEFLKTHPEFAIDRGPHKFLVTFNPNGWLRRVL